MALPKTTYFSGIREYNDIMFLEIVYIYPFEISKNYDIFDRRNNAGFWFWELALEQVFWGPAEIPLHTSMTIGI